MPDKSEKSESRKSGDPTTSDVSVPSTRQSSSKSQDSSGRVKLVNRTNRNIELDFGRDKEVRIPARGEATMPREYLKHPRFKHEESNLVVVGR